jgi:hypothetical protein
MDLEETEATNDCAGEGQQRINQSTDQVKKSTTLQFKKQRMLRQDYDGKLQHPVSHMRTSLTGRLQKNFQKRK